jgi:CheY-like chemotaxis protein
MDKAMTRTKLVLVDDHQDSVEAFSVLLGEKYTVFGYASAVEALQAIDAAKPDVLVLDIGMYPVDGIECLKTIRAMPGYRDIPAVAFTGFAHDFERQRFLDAGFQAVVVKPVLDLGELTAVIDRLVNAAAPAALQTPTRPRWSSAVATPSAAAADLDGRAAMTASGADGSAAAERRRPA